MLLPTTHGHGYYTTFYLLASLINFLLLGWEGWRRGFALRPWLVLMVSTSLAFVLGTKLIALPFEAWGGLLADGQPLDTARSVVGGGLAAGVVVLVLRSWLRLSWQVLDALALPLSVALVVQCVGCLLTGCCFGVPTTAAWGLRYAAGTPAWWAQVQAGLLPASAASSLPVVPTQVLALLLCAAVAGVLLATRRRAWPVGSWMLLQTGLLLLGRCALEGWRDAASEPVGGTAHLLLGWRWLDMQIVLLPISLLALGVWWWQIRRPVLLLSAAHPVAPVPAGRCLVVVAGLLMLTAMLPPAALTPPETFVLRGVLLVVLALEAGRLLAPLPAWEPNWLPRWLPLGLAIAIVVGTSQGPATSDSTVASRLSLSADFQQSSYTDIVDDAGCGSARNVIEYEHRTRVAGGEVRYDLAHPVGRPAVSLGVGAWGGTDRVTATQTKSSAPGGIGAAGQGSFPLYAISPFGEVNFVRPRRFGGGLRLGVNMGKLGHQLPNFRDTSQTVLRVGPQLVWWLGWRETIFMQTDLGLGPNSLGHYVARYGLGSGLGYHNGGFLLAGVAAPVGVGSVVSNDRTQLPGPMGFVSGQVRLPHTHLSLEPMLLTDFDRNYQVNFRVNWQVPSGRR